MVRSNNSLILQHVMVPFFMFFTAFKSSIIQQRTACPIMSSPARCYVTSWNIFLLLLPRRPHAPRRLGKRAVHTKPASCVTCQASGLARRGLRRRRPAEEEQAPVTGSWHVCVCLLAKAERGGRGLGRVASASARSATPHVENESHLFELPVLETKSVQLKPCALRLMMPRR